MRQQHSLPSCEIGELARRYALETGEPRNLVERALRAIVAREPGLQFHPVASGALLCELRVLSDKRA